MEMRLRGMGHMLPDRKDPATLSDAEREDVRADVRADKKSAREVLHEQHDALAPREEPHALVEAVTEPLVIDEPVALESAADLKSQLTGSGLAAPMPGEAHITPEAPRNVVGYEAPPPPAEDAPQGGIIRRMARSRFAKGVYALAAVFGLGGKAIGAVEDYRNVSEKREQAHEVIRELAMESGFAMAERYGVLTIDLPTPDDTLHFPDGGTATRGEMMGKLDTWYTKLIVDSHGPMGIMTDQCGTELPDGTNGLDAFKCNDLYGDQVQLDDKALRLLAEVHGYTIDEINAHGKIIRNSVMQRPSGVVIGDSTLAMTYFDLPNLSDAFDSHRREIYDGYYDDASKIAFSAIRALDITSSDNAKIVAVQDTIQAEILLSNATMQVAGDMIHITNDYTADTLIHGLDNNATGEHFDSHIDALHAAQEDAELAWKKLAAYESLNTGPLHAMENGMIDVHRAKLDTLLRSGRDAGDHVDFFLDQLEKLGQSEHR